MALFTKKKKVKGEWILVVLCAIKLSCRACLSSSLSVADGDRMQTRGRPMSVAVARLGQRADGCGGLVLA